MAQNIIMKSFNGTGFNEYYPKTTASQVQGLNTIVQGLESSIQTKQNRLTAGDGINISNDIISSSAPKWELISTFNISISGQASNVAPTWSTVVFNVRLLHKTKNTLLFYFK